MTHRSRKILYVHNSADLYGASRSLIRLLRHLDRRRFTPLVLLPCGGPLQVELQAIGVHVEVEPRLAIITRQSSLPSLLVRFPVSVWRLWRLMRRERVDLVHTNTGVIASSGLAARLAGVPHIWHVRDWFQEFRGLWKFYSWYMRLVSEKIIAVSRAVAEQFAEQSKVVVIHNGFTLDDFQGDYQARAAELRATLGMLPGEVLVVCIGRIKLVRKGQEVLVEAAALLKERGVHARFAFFGATSPGFEHHLEKLRMQARDREVDDRVIFAGELFDTRPAYAAADIFVLPSCQPEPFGGVIMEAMAMGIPVVATNIGGSVEQVAPDETGYLVAPGDAAALADRLAELISHRELRERLGANGLARVSNRFGIEKMMSELEAVYEEAWDDTYPVRQSKGGRARVLFVNNSADIYGASRCLLRMVAHLSREEFDAAVLLPEEGPLAEMFRSQGVTVIMHPQLCVITRAACNPPGILKLLSKLPVSVWLLIQLIRREGIDLVHTNTGVILSPALAARLAGIPHVWHIREWFGEFGAIWPFYAGMITLLSSVVLNISRVVGGQFKANPKLQVVYDGLPSKEFLPPSFTDRALARAQFGFRNEVVVLGCIGRIKWVRKGQEVLVQAVRVLQDRGLRVQCLLVGLPFPGNESHLERLKQLTTELGLTEDVCLAGELADPRPAYAAMDVFVLPSANPEPFGMVVTEAMAMSLPVVCTNFGGPIEQVADGVSGFHVPASDVQALADRLEVLVRDADLRQRFGQAGLRRVREEFTMEATLKGVEGAYRACLLRP